MTHLVYTHRLIVVLAITLFSLDAAAIERIAYKYEREMDYEILTIGSITNGEAIGVYKRYLSKRKARYSPEDAVTASYSLLDTVNGAENIITLPSDNLHYEDSDYSVVNTYFGNGSAVLPFFPVRNEVNVTNLELAFFRYRDGQIHQGERAISDDSGRSIGSAYAVQNGFLITEYDRAEQRLWFWDEEDKNSVEIDIAPAKFNVVEIYDIVESNQALYILSKVIKTSGDSSYLITELGQTPDVEDVKKHYYFEPYRDRAGVAKFVRGGVGVPSVLLRSVGENIGSSSLQLIKVSEDGHSVVWEKELERVGDYRKLSVVKVCRDKYVLAEAYKRRKSGRESNVEFYVRFKLMGRGEKMKTLSKEVRITNSVFRNMTLTASGEKVFLGINFARFERERREDGWYNWNGFQISVLTLKRGCG